MAGPFIGLFSTLFFLSQSLAASPPISQQIKRLRRRSSGTDQTNGRVLQGKLVSTAGPADRERHEDQ